ncbi:relaxase/mobilization nuclease domain-containing protein [Escherichia coli]|uniref:MobP1 family relaxase n=1 Tax=Enterobacterales TaxID=91347 RepID=UPI000DFAF535|nr:MULTISPECIES: MobP1 family relaxase [Enterobacterales]MDN6080443.1 relaxase/mobilization nuclease domain-containing protein [Leuconostoc sp.]EFE7905044.1 relaxase/mobilization nuclease domain-containing protein [Escherichia coli]EFI4615425.1 relaxase/mobilization nuclease domain-containing protein [Escherichia coli]EFM2409730.1 relaxase/mobilization nuclease domain-containing protein [Escherichia coli]EFN4546485.1 relaxase/mobilization nuclease domain-containing protein [Escherichia coli]
MGVFVENEYRTKRAKSSDKASQPAKLTGRQSHASKSAFNHKAQHGSDKKSYGSTPSKEVTFKITGSGKTVAGIKNGVDYITREGELEAYCYDGNGIEVSGKGDDFNKEFTVTLAKGNDYDKKYRGENIDHVKNMVFSPPPDAKVSREDALKATAEFLKESYPNHAFVAVYHDDKEKHPHVHVNFKLKNEDTEKRLRLTKDETKKFRQGFYRKLEGMGYDVAATWKKDPERKREVERLQAENPKRLRNVYKVVEFGETAYQNKAGEKRTPYLTYETLKGGKQVTIWGKDLKSHFESEKLQAGTLVKIKKLSPTRVRSPMFNDDGSVAGYRESQRSNWQIENIGIERNREREIPKAITNQPDDKAVKQQIERKNERSRNIGFALENGFTKDSTEHKKQKQEQERGWKGFGF